MHHTIQSESELRQYIGKAPEAISKKKIAFLEQHSITYLTHSHLMVIACEAFEETIRILSPKQGEMVFDETLLTIKPASAYANTDETPCAMYILISGFEESLRINGTVTVQDGVFRIAITECYFHCAKSIRRSQFWTPVDYASQPEVQEGTLQDAAVQDFIEQSPFLLMFTQNEQGHADLSPRGDPGGFLKVVEENKLLIPERPGNKIADSLTNLLSRSQLSLLLFCPGSSQVMYVSGTAIISNDPAYLSQLEVQGKLPKVASVLTVEKVEMRSCEALAQANIWDEAQFVDRSILPSLGKIVADQVQQEKGLLGKQSLMGKVLGKSLASASEALIQNDYKKNLY